MGKRLYIIAGVLGVALFLTFVLFNPFEFHDHFVEPPLLMEDFALQTINGKVFRLSEQQGKIVLLFFGYTSCPDICPNTLATFEQVHEGLGNDGKEVSFVMLSVDPERDTPEKVATYVAQFNSDFIGLSGSPTDLEPIWKQLGILVEKQNLNADNGYLESHTASIYVIDQHGYFIRTIPYGTNSKDIIEELIWLLQQK